MMNKQETQEAVEAAKIALAEIESAAMADLEAAAFATYDMGYAFTTKLQEVRALIADLEARIASPEYNAPVTMTTNYAVGNGLNWFPEGLFEIAEVNVDSLFVGGRWEIIANALGEVFLESSAGWATSFRGFASLEEAKAGAQAAIEALGAILTERDGADFVCEEFRSALNNFLTAAKATV